MDIHSVSFCFTWLECIEFAILARDHPMEINIYWSNSNENIQQLAESHVIHDKKVGFGAVAWQQCPMYLATPVEYQQQFRWKRDKHIDTVGNVDGYRKMSHDWISIELATEYIEKQ